MRDKELAGVPHGFRSTLRTWLTDNTEIPFEVAEMIIAHETGSKVARAYNRTDYLEQRRPYMEMWADFLDQGYKTCAAKLASSKCYK
jgi:integrase